MKVILFDGVCNLCNGLVNWIIDRDKKKIFQFSSLQSVYGQDTIKRLHLTGQYLDTIVYVDGDKSYQRSAAVLHLLRDLGGIYSLCFIFIIVPSFISDFFYNIVARNRYKWFGRRDTCRVPTPELKSRFLE
jgi:predicted DCC family thiol-disulfide oxidoreductase YuxK